MATYYVTRAVVKVECEACGYPHSYEKVLRESSDEVLFEIIENREVGVKRCPKCSFIQSWMVNSYKTWWTIFGFFLGIFNLVFFAWILHSIPFLREPLASLIKSSYSGWVGLIFVASIIALTMFTCYTFIKPNRIWIRRHGKLPSPQKPQVILKKPGFFDGEF